MEALSVHWDRPHGCPWPGPTPCSAYRGGTTAHSNRVCRPPCAAQDRWAPAVRGRRLCPSLWLVLCHLPYLALGSAPAKKPSRPWTERLPRLESQPADECS